MQELVSVVIPAYRAQDFVEAAIRSVHAQTWRPIEVIAVDDCSPDDTASIVNAAAAELDTEGFRVRLVRRPSNGGVAEALRTGFSAADGDFVCWLSADDLFVDPEKTMKQVGEMRRGAQLVYASIFLQGADLSSARVVEGHWSHRLSGPIDRAFNRRRHWRVLGYMFGNPINGSTVMMRRGLMDEYGGFDKFDESGQNLDSDADLWLRLSALGVEFATTSGAPSALYRVHAAQGSQARESEWRRDCQVVRVRVLSAFEAINASDRLFSRGWPALLLALRARYRTFPQVARAVCEAGDRASVGPVASVLIARLKSQLIREGLWDSEEYAAVVAGARAASKSEEFRAFVGRLEASGV